MPITLRCPGCLAIMKLHDSLAGKRVRCPRCKTVFIVPDDERIQLAPPPASRPHKVRIAREDEYRHKPPAIARPSKYKPCPRCGAEDPTLVKWTSWGSFYGPKLFTHVRCPECGYCYNGKTGRSNALAATAFVLVPLLGIVGILGAVIYVIIQRGYASL